MIAKILVFTIVNTITVVGYQFINTMIAHGLKYRSRFVYFTKHFASGIDEYPINLL